jgi:ferritin
MKNNIINESIISVDPTIVKNPNLLRSEIISLLNKRIGDEYTAHYFYRSAANWCKDRSYKKASAFFDAESHSELEHAEKIQNFLTDWNTIPTIPQPTQTNVKFNNLAEIVVQAYDMEFGLLQAYLETSKLALNLDLNTFDFLQELRKIQNDAVVEYADLINALQLINPENNFELLYFENQYFN